MAFRAWGRRCLAVGLLAWMAPPLWAQAPYVAGVTEAQEKEWRGLVALAQSAYAQGYGADAVEHARKALTIADELFGPDDPRALISANDLALIVESAGQYRAAEQLLRRVFDSYRQTRGEDDPACQMALENLVDFYLARKRPDAARPLAKYALETFRRTTGSASERSRRMAGILAQIPDVSADMAAD